MDGQIPIKLGGYGSGVFIGVEFDGEACSRLGGTMYVDVETLVEIIRLVEIIILYIFPHVQSDTQTHTYIPWIHKSVVEKMIRIMVVAQPRTSCRSLFNPLTPNDHYMGRTAQLTSRCCILYIYSTNIRTDYFKHAAKSPFFLFKMQFIS